MYEPRFYRSWSTDHDLVSFNVVVKETDLYIRARRNLEDRSRETVLRLRGLIEEYIRHVEAMGEKDSYDTLTEREREVLQLIAEGHPNRQTAELLHVSVKTVETHRAHLMDKLDIHSTAGLTRYAIRKGVISADQ